MKYIKILFWALLLITLGIVINRWFSSPGTLVLKEKNLTEIEWPRTINFAGETLPLDNFLVREDWEKDFLILLDSDYQTILYLKRSEKYFPFIEKELDRRNLPQDLKYIAVAESALKENSTSSAGAKGIWQFMPATARQYGLTVTGDVDERLHFEKATHAALDYLQYLYEKFESWSLAAAGYNAGHNRIIGHLVDQQVTTYHDLYMNAETSRYLFRILAIKEIMEHPQKYKIFLNEKDFFRWPSFTRKTVRSIEDLSQWAQENGSNLKMIKALNPWILGDSLPLGTWEVKVPQ